MLLSVDWVVIDSHVTSQYIVTYEVPVDRAQSQSQQMDSLRQQHQQRLQQLREYEEKFRRESIRQRDEATTELVDLARVGRMTEWRPLPLASDGQSSERLAELLGSNCSICLEPLAGPEAAGSSTTEVTDETPIILGRCHGHAFHAGCIRKWYKPPPPVPPAPDSPAWMLPELRGHVECPMCKKVYGGVRTGDAPAGYAKLDYSMEQLPQAEGEGASRGHFVLRISIPDGVQHNGHPIPGAPFTGKSLVAFFPDSFESRGRLIVPRILEAYRRRLLFKVGESGTTGRTNVVTFSSIPLKTNKASGGTEHGFPDGGYVKRVSDVLDLFGVDLCAITSRIGCDHNEQAAREVKISSEALTRFCPFDPPPYDENEASKQEQTMVMKRVQREQALPDVSAMESDLMRVGVGSTSVRWTQQELRSTFDSVERAAGCYSTIIKRSLQNPLKDPTSVAHCMVNTMSDEEHAATAFLTAAYECGRPVVMNYTGGDVPTIGQLATLFRLGVTGPFLIVCPFEGFQGWSALLKRHMPFIQTILYHGSKQVKLISPAWPFFVCRAHNCAFRGVFRHERLFGKTPRSSRTLF